MQKLFAIILIALFAVSCTGSRGCGCPSWGAVPSDDKSDQVSVMMQDVSDEYVWH
ncbi:MAG: hypothetical protein GY751_21240 [Bacteroidetes bacterium]|nr:hypothetical protein [Bacteroidota bacterium]